MTPNCNVCVHASGCRTRWTFLHALDFGHLDGLLRTTKPHDAVFAVVAENCGKFQAFSTIFSVEAAKAVAETSLPCHKPGERGPQ